MENKYLEKIEYNKILDIIKDFAVTDIGKNLVMALLPCSNKDEVCNNINKTTSAYILINRKGNPPLSEIQDIEEYLNILVNGGFINISALLSITKILKQARQLKEYFSENCELNENSILEEYFSNLYSNIKIEQTISDSILDEETLSDTASPKLNSIRKSIKSQKQTIKNRLSEILKSKYIQEPVVSIRNDRYVVLVKQEYKNEIKGFVHDISSSGLTVYIEPTNIFELNNKLIDLKMEEKIEIENILKNLSNLLIPITSELKQTVNLIGKIDFTFAKAKYAIKMDCTEPLITDERLISLNSARHPLIDKNLVVPIDVTLGKDYSCLVITGPNAGGKTVTLKTVGLLCALAMSGLYIPAKANSKICVFDNIFADIGDDQSIAESLSTFSSHMKNIKQITKLATKNSLVLLDELGSGTDPIEGSNLAISILEYLHSKKVLTIATTHYQELKQYAYLNTGFENASSDFDVENLKPTYKLIIGVPGKSNAFAIAEKIGIGKEIIDNAKNRMSQNQTDFESLLKDINNSKLLIDAEKENILKNSNEIKELKQQLENKNLDLQTHSKEILNKAKLEAKDILLQAKDDVNQLINELDKSDSRTRNNIRNKLNDKIKNIKIDTEILPNKSLTYDEVRIGLNVFIPSIKQNGTILSINTKKNQVEVQVGNVKMKYDIKMLQKSSEPIKKDFAKQSISKLNTQTVQNEINVIGLNIEQANEIIDKYLDTASLVGLNDVRIIHGKGTGALRSGIHNFLKTHPHVKSFRLGTFGEGETGATVVELK